MGWKIEGSWRFWGGVSDDHSGNSGCWLTVMRRVFDGGEGLIKGGTAERSSDIGVLVPRDSGLEGAEFGGEFELVAIASSLLNCDYYYLAVDADTEGARCERKRSVGGAMIYHRLWSLHSISHDDRLRPRHSRILERAVPSQAQHRDKVSGSFAHGGILMSLEILIIIML